MLQMLKQVIHGKYNSTLTNIIECIYFHSHTICQAFLPICEHMCGLISFGQSVKGLFNSTTLYAVNRNIAYCAV